MRIQGKHNFFLRGGILLIVGVFVCFWWFILPQPLFRVPYATVLEDSRGKIIGLKNARDEQLRFRPSKKLPERYLMAVLAFEDRLFVFHQGVNGWALCLALYQNIEAGRVVSGGSTLSMQVVRMALGNSPRTIWQKCKEILLTFRLEQCYSKLEILQLYAAHAPFGGNVVGLEAASFKYFNRRPEQLSWAEAALLAVLPNSPALIYPGKNNLLLKQKRDRLLKRLYSYGLLKEDSYHLALAEPLPKQIYEQPMIAPHLLARACQEKEGEVCRSYIDAHLQVRVNEIVERHTERLSSNYIYNMAVLVAHVPTGEVRAYVGNSPARSGSQGNEVDVIRALRSPGSILKPALYALMLQNGFILPRTLLPDVPSRFGDYAPSNFSRDFKGAVPANQALAQSLNIPFVRLLKEYTYGRFYDELKRLGISSLNQPADHYGLSLILGGAEVSLWEVCNLYGGMATVLSQYASEDGRYFSEAYERLKLWQEEDSAKVKSLQLNQSVLLNAAPIWQTFQALEEVERPEIESGWKNFVSALNLSWKTGTSFGFRDAWAVGVNADYVIGVWVGNANGEGRPGLVGVRTAAPVLFEVAALLPSTSIFYEPIEEMQELVVCRKSGFRAGDCCEERDTIRSFPTGQRTPLCPYHRYIYLDQTDKWRVSSACESVQNMQRRSWFVLPPVQEWYYSRTHADYRHLPPYRPDCLPEKEEMMEMIYPQRGTRVFIPRTFGGKAGRVVFEVVHREIGTEIYWHVDDCYLGVTHQVHQMELFLHEGKHQLTLVDGHGNMLQQDFQVVGKENPVVEIN